MLVACYNLVTEPKTNMTTKATIEQLQLLIDKMRDLPKWSDRKESNGTTKTWVSVIAKLLECLSGGDVTAMLLRVVGIPVLWKSIVPSVVNDTIVKMETGDRREVLQSLEEKGWKLSFLEEAGLKIGRKAWDAKSDVPVDIGRPRKICPELCSQVESEHNAASSETSIVVKRLSAQRRETVTLQNVLGTFKSIYEVSSIRDLISESTYRRMRGKEYRHLARRTDVCSYCLCGQTIRKKLSKLLSSVERQSGYSLTVWNAARASALTLQLMVSSKGGLPASARPAAMSFINQLVEVHYHVEEFKRQNAVYSENTADPGDSLIITLDYKEKGTLPQVPQESSSHYYQQGKYSCLGIVMHFKLHDETRRQYIDLLLPHTNQDAAVTYLCLRKLWEMPLIRKNMKPIHIWCDSGTHFRNATVISELLAHPNVKSVNFFPGRHGKSHCDKHFGSISNAIQSTSRTEVVQTITDVKNILQQLDNTTPEFLFFKVQSVVVRNLSIPAITSISTYRKETNGKLFIATSSDAMEQYELSSTKSEHTLEHSPKISSNLPLTKDEKTVIGDAQYQRDAVDEEVEEVDHSKLVRTLQNKRERKDQLFAKLKKDYENNKKMPVTQASETWEQTAPTTIKKKRKKRTCGTCGAPNHDSRNCLDGSSSESSTQSSCDQNVKRPKETQKK